MEINKYTENVNREFDAYVERCRQAIYSILPQGSNESKARNRLVDVKVEHTRRVVMEIIEISKKIGLSVDFQKICEVVGRLHDIGRFEYITWNDRYGENYTINANTKEVYQDKKNVYLGTEFADFAERLPVLSHAAAGEYLLNKRGVIPTFILPENMGINRVTSEAILHHQDGVLKDELSPEKNKIDDKILNADVLALLRTEGNFNEAEKQIVAILTQLVRDVDCIDILNQHITGEFPVLVEKINFYKDDCELVKTEDGKTSERILQHHTLKEFCAKWGVDEEKVLKYNNMTRDKAEAAIKLSLPSGYKDGKIVYDEALPIPDYSLMEMPADLREKFFKNERIELQQALRRSDYSPVVGMWWRLGQFLSQLNFTSNLELLRNRQFLVEIFNKYPAELKEKVRPAFEFADEYYLNNRGTEIYVEPVAIRR